MIHYANALQPLLILFNCTHKIVVHNLKINKRFWACLLASMKSIDTRQAIRRPLPPPNQKEKLRLTPWFGRQFDVPLATTRQL